MNVPDIEFADNQDCIDLFEKKPRGLLDLLDESARLTTSTPQGFTENVHRANARHFRLDVCYLFFFYFLFYALPFSGASKKPYS